VWPIGWHRRRGAPGNVDDAVQAGDYQVLLRAVRTHEEEVLAAKVRVQPVG
jgi:hypothetical protein